jgi:hypothetical protein
MNRVMITIEFQGFRAYTPEPRQPPLKSLSLLLIVSLALPPGSAEYGFRDLVLQEQ